MSRLIKRRQQKLSMDSDSIQQQKQQTYSAEKLQSRDIRSNDLYSVEISNDPITAQQHSVRTTRNIGQKIPSRSQTAIGNSQVLRSEARMHNTRSQSQSETRPEFRMQTGVASKHSRYKSVDDITSFKVRSITQYMLT